MLEASVQTYTGERYTYADYAAWPERPRFELIEGETYLMSTPSDRHQAILGELFRQIANHLAGKPCRPFVAPFDVRLDPQGKDDTVVQPDILVVCDRRKRDGKACLGAPDLIIEILSPASRGLDRVRKYNLYRKFGVREYWIVDPEDNTVTTFVRNADGDYVSLAYEAEESVPVAILEGCAVSLPDVFADN